MRPPETDRSVRRAIGRLARCNAEDRAIILDMLDPAARREAETMLAVRMTGRSDVDDKSADGDIAPWLRDALRSDRVPQVTPAFRDLLISDVSAAARTDHRVGSPKRASLSDHVLSLFGIGAKR